MVRRLHAVFCLLLMAIPGWTAAAGEVEMKPFPIDWEHADLSAVDLSSFLDAPAGKDGFVRAEGDHLVRPDGSRFRVWGVNITAGYCFPPKDKAPAIAADLARYGINCVRFHHMDTGSGRNIFDQSRNDTQRLDPEQLDRLDFFIAEMKKRGIYANLNLNVSRRFKEGDGVRDYQHLGYAKGATYYNKRIVDLQKEYARQLLTHFNPYTKSEYRNEPAVAVVEFVNENSLVEAWSNYRLVGKEIKDSGSTWSPLPVSYANELTDQYNAWLAERLLPEQLARLRAEAGVEEGTPVPRLQRDQFAKASRERFHTEAAFIMENEERFFKEMKTLLKDELGVKSLLVGSSDHNHQISGYPHILANLLLDIVDGHCYWQHPRLQPFWMNNTPMVNNPLDSTVAQFARTPVLGRPYTISETNHPFPNEYTCEGIPILTAYSIFHDWDGIYWYALGQPRISSREKRPLRIFDFGDDPVKMSQIAACGLMFHRQDLEVAKRTIVRAYSRDEIVETIRMPQEERPFFTPGFARSTPLEHATVWHVGGEATKPFPPLAKDVIRSDTGELDWYYGEENKGLVAIETDRTQALIGFVKQRDKSLKNLGAEIDNDFCAILLTSLDGKPIPQSARLLLSTCARVANSNMKLSEDRHTAPDWGDYPPVIEPVTGAVVLRGLNDAQDIRVRPLRAEGRAVDKEIEATRDGGRWRIPVGTPPTTWYLLDVKR